LAKQQRGVLAPRAVFFRRAALKTAILAGWEGGGEAGYKYFSKNFHMEFNVPPETVVLYLGEHKESDAPN
jgi:hypothetical protein